MNKESYERAAQASPSKSHLRDVFYRAPETARMVMTTQELRATLLRTEGFIMAVGYLWDIKSKRIGPGVYAVTVEKQ